ncbi:phosphoglycerate dehydrogenase-like enzyme [Kribbella aluminosa]|uniref:Phosphoglycerate dehydrogenase-like enzyme n=1 Tax=Kribbella aluminosa TaxID=416017 RepID=A0ABS4ULV2_9ACTN|nr:hydroxyacid dehydrogenase [Kribbella aluminosa]MBP2352609.1 phosphoglycerate dehydrogenase-like enzyme [Kribbella aluminosa]
MNGETQLVPDRPHAMFALGAHYLPDLFPPKLLTRLHQLVQVDDTLVAERFDSPATRAALRSTEYLITGWGCPPVTADVLDAAPRLKAILHTAGSVKGHLTPACWERGLAITSAAAANAVPVAEYTLAAILFAGKDVFRLRDDYRTSRQFTVAEVHAGVGNHGRAVGVIGASWIGRRVIELLRPFDFEVYLFDPYVDHATADALGVHLVDLDTLMRTCDIVSVHAPDNLQTQGLVGARQLALKRDGATLINTARPALVDSAALIEHLRKERLYAVLDVTSPEPLPADSALYDLPNVFLTPHIAGSHGNELARMGRYIVDELQRLRAGQPLAYAITVGDLDRVA